MQRILASFVFAQQLDTTTMKYNLAASAILLFIPFILSSQSQLAPKKTLEALRIQEKIQVDGDFSEEAWSRAAKADSFLFQWPNPGRPAGQRTEVKVMYDDRALYVAFQCFDSSPDSVFHRITKRDELENTDAVSFIIDAYRDGQNAVQFGVSPDNVQFDVKYSIANANPNNGFPDGEDPAWDAVWYSAAKLTDYGWAAEFEIPFSALRFPKKDVQDWGMNFYRRITRSGELDSWNEIKANISGTLNQMGILSGLKGIKAPLRLSATPFFAAYADQQYNQPGSSWSYPYSFGMDIKYGINEAFTIDATLIPDFGQVRSDQQVLNLSPFEVRFQENRPFFTEGTELFNKGNLFYSRRVGGTPYNYYSAYDNLASNEEVTNNPSRPLLINASKLSGRTPKGLGIGVFNAVEAASYATITNTESGEKREFQTSPLTNKNILVFDQNLRNNSSVTLINTNVWRDGQTLDANVTGIVFNLKNKAQSYGLSGKVAGSTRYASGYNENGFTVTLEGSKTSGNLTWGGGYTLESEDYNPNDMGLLYSPNENSGYVWINYSRYKPWWKLNNFWSSAWTSAARLYKPGVWTVRSDYGLNFGGNTRTFHNFGFNGYFNPWGENDYFEPGTEDFSMYYHLPSLYRVNFWYGSDYRKKFTFQVFGNVLKVNDYKRHGYYFSAGPRWRATDKLTLGLYVGFNQTRNAIGNVLYSGGIDENGIGYDQALVDSSIIMARRNLWGSDNTFEINYSFTNKINLALYARHYWNRVEMQSYYALQHDGEITPIAYTGLDAQGQPLNDLAVNFFNIDLVFTWRFAPGSDILLVYKNNTSNFVNGVEARHTYFHNAGHLFDYAGSNTLSLKVLYFLDYDLLKRKI